MGTSQAETIGKNLDYISWKQVYSSDLPRAHNTAKILLSESKVVVPPISLSDTIREIAYGVREGLSRKFTVAEAIAEYARRNNVNVEDVVDTAEPTENVKRRQKQFVAEVLRNYLAEQSTDSPSNADITADSKSCIFQPRNAPVLCVSHGGYIKLFLKTYCDFAVTKSLGNCSVSIVTIEWSDVSDPLNFTCTTSADKVDIAPFKPSE